MKTECEEVFHTRASRRQDQVTRGVELYHDKAFLILRQVGNETEAHGVKEAEKSPAAVSFSVGGRGVDQGVWLPLVAMYGLHGPRAGAAC